MSDTIRVIVADDHAVVRKGIRDYLADEPDIEVVGEAADGAETLAQVEALQPDVVILDIQMPNVSGVEATSRIKAQHPDVKVLILTSFDNDPYIFALLKAGISGYLLKTAGPDDLGVDEMLAEPQIGRQGVGYVVDSRDQIIHHPQAEVVGQTASHLPGAEQVKQGRAGALFYTETDEEWAVGYAPVPDVGWGVIVRQPWREIVTPIMQLSVIPPALAILAALVSLVAVYLLVRYVIRPLQRLNHMAGQVAWGNFAATEAPLGGVQELRDLHATLKHMAGQIQRYQAGMQSYIAAVTQGQEEERRRLARELHDDTAQALVGLVQRIKLAQRDLERTPDRAAERLSELETLATTAWQDVRRFSEDLRPSYLEQLGLVPALTTLHDQMRPRGGPDISLTVSGPEQRLSPELELAVFRIVQEGVNNVHQHARAEQASVELRFAEDGLTVSIQDDGIGFEPPERPYDLAQQGHLGLAGMRERAMLVGGHLTVDSAPGQGTRVTAFVPYLQPD